jgi:hypothetical protein
MAERDRVRGQRRRVKWPSATAERTAATRELAERDRGGAA